MLNIKSNLVQSFIEKPQGDGGWINGGFFVLSPKCIKYIANDETSWESESLVQISQDGELAAYQHRGFWQSMDTLREKVYLEDLWLKQEAPWKTW